MNDTHRDLFARDGHLTMLSLDRYDTDELDPRARRGLELHVEGCAQCRERFGAVTTPAIAILPRGGNGRSTGSATIAVLVGSAAAALAASTMMWLGASMWPSPQPAWHEPTDSALVEGSYTSVALDELEIAGLDLDFVAARTNGRDTVIATPQGEGLLAVIVLRDDETAAGDTDGEAEPEVLAVLSQPTIAASATPIVVPVPRRWSGERIVAVLCPSAFTLEPGDTLAPDPGCVAMAAR